MYLEVNEPNPMYSLKLLLDGAPSLLDVGCGLCSSLDAFYCPIILAMDVHRPYLESRENRDQHVIPIHADAMKLSELFLPNTIGAVLFNDSLEHFSKEDGYHLLRMAEEIAYYRVAVFTPRGYFPQTNYDFYEMGGEKYQEHRSGWEAEDFLQLGYHVKVLKGFHHAKNPSFAKNFGPDHPPVDAILAWKEM